MIILLVFSSKGNTQIQSRNPRRCCSSPPASSDSGCIRIGYASLCSWLISVSRVGCGFAAMSNPTFRRGLFRSFDMAQDKLRKFPSHLIWCRGKVSPLVPCTGGNGFGSFCRYKMACPEPTPKGPRRRGRNPAINKSFHIFDQQKLETENGKRGKEGKSLDSRLKMSGMTGSGCCFLQP